MNSQELLLGELKEFKHHISREVSEIKTDVRALLRFRWKILGFASGSAFLATLLVELVRR